MATHALCTTLRCMASQGRTPPWLVTPIELTAFTQVDCKSGGPASCCSTLPHKLLTLNVSLTLAFPTNDLHAFVQSFMAPSYAAECTLDVLVAVAMLDARARMCEGERGAVVCAMAMLCH